MDASRSTPQTQLNPERFTEKRPARILQLGLAADGPLTSARWGTSQVKSNISSCTAVVEGSLDASRVCIVISNPGSNQAHWDLEPMAGSEMGIAPAGCNVDVVAPPGTHFVFVPRAELAALIESLDEPKFRADQLFQWIYGRGVTAFDDMTNLSKSLRAKLADRYVVARLGIARDLASTDGTHKWLLRRLRWHPHADPLALVCGAGPS